MAPTSDVPVLFVFIVRSFEKSEGVKFWFQIPNEVPAKHRMFSALDFLIKLYLKNRRKFHETNIFSLFLFSISDFSKNVPASKNVFFELFYETNG